MRSFLFAVACVLPLAGCKPEPAPVPPASQVADREIEALLVAFEKSGLSFERNGEAYDNSKAGTWLRLKWSRRAKSIHSAEDFIRQVAHHSSETKQPYQVILADGTKEASAAWFSARLEEFRRQR